MTASKNHPSAKQTRQLLREELRKKRRDISSLQRARFDQAISQHLLALIESHKISSLAAYWPFDGEPDMIPLCRQLLDNGVEVALPKIAENGHDMQFHAWRPELALVKNRFGIPEPAATEAISLSACPLLMMPLVAYDMHGNRLGIGSGYYDRHLESMRYSPQPLRLGIAYSLQQVELLSHNEWDIPLHAVINENGLFTLPGVN